MYREQRVGWRGKQRNEKVGEHKNGSFDEEKTECK